MLPFPFYEMSHCVRCPFALPWLCLLPHTPLQFFPAMIGHYLLHSISPPICFPLATVSFSTLLFLHPHRVSLYLLSSAHSHGFTCFCPNWYLAQMAAHVLCSGPLSDSFTDLVLVHLLKLAQVERVHTTVLNWWCLWVILFGIGQLMLKERSHWFPVSDIKSHPVWSQKKIKLWMTMAPYPAVKSDAYPRSFSIILLLRNGLEILFKSMSTAILWDNS